MHTKSLFTNVCPENFPVLSSVLCFYTSDGTGAAFAAGEGLYKITWNCSLENKLTKKNYFTHFCPLQSHNKIHPYCLAFTYRALWVSLSLVCTTERVDVRLQRTGLSKKIYITFLWRLSSGKETAEGYGLAERTRDPWSIQSVRHHNASARYFSPCYRPRAQTTIWRGFSSLPKHCKVNTSGVGSWI